MRELCTQSSETERYFKQLILIIMLIYNYKKLLSVILLPKSFCQNQGIDFVSSSFQFSVPGVSHLYVYFVLEIVLAIIIIFINAVSSLLNQYLITTQ